MFHIVTIRERFAFWTTYVCYTSNSQLILIIWDTSKNKQINKQTNTHICISVLFLAPFTMSSWRRIPSSLCHPEEVNYEQLTKYWLRNTDTLVRVVYFSFVFSNITFSTSSLLSEFLPYLFVISNQAVLTNIDPVFKAEKVCHFPLRAFTQTHGASPRPLLVMTWEYVWSVAWQTMYSLSRRHLSSVERDVASRENCRREHLLVLLSLNYTKTASI